MDEGKEAVYWLPVDGSSQVGAIPKEDNDGPGLFSWRDDHHHGQEHFYMFVCPYCLFVDTGESGPRMNAQAIYWKTVESLFV